MNENNDHNINRGIENYSDDFPNNYYYSTNIINRENINICYLKDINAIYCRKIAADLFINCQTSVLFL